ncbi:hypothetical protein ACSBR1_018120 [Camellia fascicularis]
MLIGSYDSGDDLSVIAIVGMGGMGKTTLAQLVYKNKKVVKHFGDRRMWICVSNDFIVKRLLNEMVQSLTRDQCEMENIEGIVRKLQEKLYGKKYLLVLDDVWNEIADKWECMRNSLLGIGGSKGSKIIATTRSMHVVSTMRTSPSLTHHLSQLSENESWTMFRKRAFANGGPTETPNLLAIGRKMVKKCKGVPLAIKSLGGLMYSKQYNYEWVSIENSEIWGSTEIKNGIQPILRLSFDHLPSPYLKHCFAYCSIFPKDFNIQKDELIQLWMAQGYLQPSSGSNLEMEDVGNNYFNILLHNSLFQDIKLDVYNNIICCKMHDLALDVSEGNCLALTWIAGEVNYHPEVQHLSLDLRGKISFKFPKENVGKLRTLLLKQNLPKNIAKIECIRALKKFYELVSLRHFCFDDTKKNRELMPMMIGKLTSLQTIPFFVVGEDKGQKIEELGSLSKLRGKLMIYNLQQVKSREEAEKAKILGKPNICELGFHWDRKFEGQNFASWMMSGRDAQLLQNLVKIELSECTRCEQVPPLGHLPHLEVIRIEAETTATAATVVFPALRELLLDDMPNIEEWCGLGVSSSSSDTTMLFPLLEWLFIRNCPELITIPSHLLPAQELIICGFPSKFLPDKPLPEWLGNLSSVRSLELCWCHNLMNLPTMEAMQRLTNLQSLTIGGASAGTLTSAGISSKLQKIRQRERLKVENAITIYMRGIMFVSKCPRPSTLKFVDIDKSICKWRNNRDSGFVVLILSQKYLLDQLQRLIALKVLSIEDFDGFEALLECLGNLSSLSFFEASELRESDESSYTGRNAMPHQFMIFAYL